MVKLSWPAFCFVFILEVLAIASIALDVHVAVVIALWCSWVFGLAAFLCSVYSCRGFLATKELQKAVQRGDIHSAAWLLRKGELAHAPSDVLHYARDIGIARLLIDAGADVNARWLGETHGGTPLCYAVVRNDLAVAKLFVDAGAELDVAAENGMTPILCARSLAMAQLLVNGGADCRRQALNGATVLHMAVSRRSVELVRYFASIVGPNVRGPHQSTALYNATPDTIKELIALGCDIDARDEFGGTVLHCVAQQDRLQEIALLLACHLSPSCMERSGSTPIELCHSRAAAALFLAAGSDKGRCRFQPNDDEVCLARRDIALQRMGLIRARSFEICLALHSLDLPALLMCTILEFACAPFAVCVPFHLKWNLAVTVKHAQQVENWVSARSSDDWDRIDV